MTDEQIESSIKVCSETYKVHCGVDCPHKLQGGCRQYLMANSLDYINRLKEEKYRLEQNLGQCENGYCLELLTARSQIRDLEEDKQLAETQLKELLSALYQRTGEQGFAIYRKDVVELANDYGVKEEELK